MNQKPTVVVPSDPKKIDELIFALEYQLAHDENQKRQRNSQSGPRKIKGCQVEKSPPKRWAFVLQKGTLIFSIAFYEKAITPDAIQKLHQVSMKPGMAYVFRTWAIHGLYMVASLEPLSRLGFKRMVLLF